jgi:hypothetical protein
MHAYATLCPTNFNIIEAGYTKEQVEKQCGKPAKINESEKAPSIPQEWTYYVQAPASLDLDQQPSVKITTAFDQDGKLINASVNGIGVQSTDLCGQTIQLNDPIEKVKSACGAPAMLNKQETAPQTGKPFSSIKVEEWVYNDPFNTVLIFENDQFVKVKD